MEFYTFALTLFLGQIACVLLLLFFGSRVVLWTLKNVWGAAIGVAWLSGGLAIVVQSIDPSALQPFQTTYAPYGLLLNFLLGLWFLHLSKVESAVKTAAQKAAHRAKKWIPVSAILGITASMISALIMVVGV